MAVTFTSTTWTPPGALTPSTGDVWGIADHDVTFNLPSTTWSVVVIPMLQGTARLVAGSVYEIVTIGGDRYPIVANSTLFAPTFGTNIFVFESVENTLLDTAVVQGARATQALIGVGAVGGLAAGLAVTSTVIGAVLAGGGASALLATGTIISVFGFGTFLAGLLGTALNSLGLLAIALGPVGFAAVLAAITTADVELGTFLLSCNITDATLELLGSTYRMDASLTNVRESARSGTYQGLLTIGGVQHSAAIRDNRDGTSNAVIPTAAVDYVKIAINTVDALLPAALLPPNPGARLTRYVP